MGSLENHHPFSLAFRVRGHSMRYLLHPNDWILVDPLPLDRAQWGDLLVFSHSRSPEMELIVHRIIWKYRTDDGWEPLLRGDWRDDPDAPPKTIIGRARAVVRNGREISLTGPVMRLIGGVVFFYSRMIKKSYGLANQALAPFQRHLGAPLMGWASSEPTRPRLALRWVLLHLSSLGDSLKDNLKALVSLCPHGLMILFSKPYTGPGLRDNTEG